MKVFDTAKSVILNKCPRCHSGDVFEDKNPYHFSSLSKVHPVCSHCGLKYEREPGFFYGAMYVSYALTSGWFMVWYFLNSIWLEIETVPFLVFLLISFIVLAPVTFRWSRLIWLNFFNSYDRHLKKIKSV